MPLPRPRGAAKNIFFVPYEALAGDAAVWRPAAEMLHARLAARAALPGAVSLPERDPCGGAAVLTFFRMIERLTQIRPVPNGRAAPRGTNRACAAQGRGAAND